MSDLKQNGSGHAFDEFRIYDGINRGNQIHINFDGRQITAYEGESVAAAIYATGKRDLRISSNYNEKRGIYCGTGMCFECVMTIDDIPGVRSCQTPVKSGMIVKSQKAEGTWKTI